MRWTCAGTASSRNGCSPFCRRPHDRHGVGSPVGDAGAWGGRHGAADRAGLAATPTVARTLPERVAAGRLAGERLWRRLASGAIHSPAPAVGAARRAGPLPHVPSGGPPAALQLSDREHPHRAAGAQGTMDLRRRHSVRPTVPVAVRGPRRGALPPTLRPGAGPVSPRARSSPAAGGRSAGRHSLGSQRSRSLDSRSRPPGAAVVRAGGVLALVAGGARASPAPSHGGRSSGGTGRLERHGQSGERSRPRPRGGYGGGPPRRRARRPDVDALAAPAQGRRRTIHDPGGGSALVPSPL